MPIERGYFLWKTGKLSLKPSLAQTTKVYLDITYGLQVVESSSLVSVLFRETFFSVTNNNNFKIFSSISSDEIPP